MFQTKFVEKIKTHFMFGNFFFFENRAVYEITWKNIVERGRSQMRMWRMCKASWILKGYKYTHSGCVILIAFPLQQRWYERASVLRYMSIACLLVNCTRAVGERAHNNGRDPLLKKKDTPTFDDVI